MSTQDTTTPDAELGDAQLTSSGAEEAVVSPDTLTLDELNSFLGKQFPDKATALKSLKDTQSFVGKKVESASAAPVDPNLAAQLQNVNTRLFYSENPQYKGHEALIATMGADPAEVVKSPTFQAVFEKLKTADEAAQSASVVHSNPRLAQNKDVTEQAIATANAAGTSQSDVADVFAAAINEELAGQ